MTNSLLRQIILCGPEWTAGEPFWELAAAAPDAYADIQSPQEDHIHPLRVLTIDAENSGAGDGFREPCLMSIHLLVGHGEGKYSTRFGKKIRSPIHPKKLFWPKGFKPLPNKFGSAPPNNILIHKIYESLKVSAPDLLEPNAEFLTKTIPSRIKWSLSDESKFTTDAYFYSNVENFEEKKNKASDGFQHVVVKPIVTSRDPWPGKFDGAIAVPKFELVTGRVNLGVAERAFDWLGSLQPTAVSGNQTIPRYPLWLTPEGIELQTRVNFPGTAAQLDGYFLLSPIEGKLRLTLLPDKLNELQRSTWNTAWQNVLPKGRDIESLAGFRVEGNPGAIPEFRWTLDIAEVREDIRFGLGFRIVSDTKNLPVEIPSQYLRVNMLSPTRSGTDGAINCTGGYFYLGSMDSLHAIFKDLFGETTFVEFTKSIGKQDPLLLLWSTPKTDAPSTENIKNQYLKMSAKGTKVDIELVANESGYSCSFDERRVAHLLREAYGLPALIPKDSVPDDPIMGFVPLTDGWLQIPLTNYPPLNPDSDSEMLLNTTKTKVNVLDGFLRYSQQQELPQVLSAFNKNSQIESFVKEAPWTVTLEGAENFSIAIVLDKTTPINGLARLDNPDISARGLLWLSTDRPDKLEAIPRMGAGPGAFIDIPLELKETQDEAERKTYVSIDKIEINVDTANGVLVTREDLSLTLFSSDGSKPNPIHWARHPRMPLAAQMPMTRSANSAVRPLESCDLFPLELFPALNKTKKIARLSWSNSTAFPELTGDFYQSVSKDWPLSLFNKESPAPVIGVDNALEVRGVGWYAFGVPGAEITFKKGDAWNLKESWPLLATYRFDVPSLDTAFAFSTLPPTKDEQTQESQSPVVSVSVPTANNWPEFIVHWGEQERRLQNCRVSHSYASDYKAIDDFKPTAITSLIGGFFWNAPHFGFGNPTDKSALPYGHLKIGGDEQLNGNEALKGITKKFEIQDTLLVEVKNGTIQVLGNSPSSFVLEEYIVDARGSGVKSLEPSKGWWRPVKDFGEKKAGIAGRFTSEKMIEVKAAGDNNFSFWFKDIPLTPKITPTTEALTFQSEDQIDTHAWQDGHIQSSGYEWRLTESKSETLGNGEYRFPFMGFILEPLQLKSVSFLSASNCPNSNIPEEVLIVARLHLGAQPEDVDDGGNLVTLTLKRNQHNSTLDLENVTSENSFVFQIYTGGNAVKIRADSVSWNPSKKIFSLTNPSIQFEFAGSKVVLNNPIDNSTNDSLKFNWEQKPNGHSYGAVYITRAELYIAKDNINNIAKGDTNNVHKGDIKFLFDYTIAIAPGFESSENTEPTVTIEVENENLDSIVRKGKFRILGASAQVDIIPSKNAFSVISKDQTPLTGSLIDGFPNSANICVGLISTIDAFDADASAKILSGVLSGKIDYTKAKDQSTPAHFDLDYAYLSAHLNQRSTTSAANRSNYWSGSLSLFGSVKGRSAIAWPEIVTADGNSPEIPFPPNDKSGLNSVKIISERSCTHDVEWILDGHLLPLETARNLFFGDNKEGVWTTQAVAKHTIKNAQKTLEFSSVDSLVLGVVGALIPEWSTSLEDKNLNSTFAARYKNQNPLAKNIPDPGMAWPGRGGLGTVLQGTWSSAFREDFRAHHDQVEGLDKKMVLTGGFLGLVYQTEEHAPLVRLPVLMGLSDGILQANGDAPLISQKGENEATYKLPWPDSLAAAPVAVTFRSAVTPSSASEADLEATIHHGAKSLLANGDEWHRTSSSLLVEQSFPVAFTKETFFNKPYFLASAAAITRLMYSILEKPPINTLSVVSSTFTHIDKRTQALKHVNKVAVLLRSLTKDQESKSTQTNKTPNIPATLFSVGDDVVAWEWPGLVFDGTETNDILNSQATSKAFTFHAHPLVAMMRDTKGNFRRVTLPLPKIKPQKRAVLVQTFSDSGRGYKLPVRETKTMAGVEEGGVQAVRDDDQENKDSSKKYRESGIAGLTHIANLPSSAADMKSNNELVWITQQRAPIYLPLQSKITSEPIPWLVPARPLTRVPLSKEIYKKLPGLEDTQKEWQPVVAEQLMTASISERPGVLMANQLRLEMASSAEAVFDPLHPKFGQAAQSSSSFFRTVRTPRPAKLPANTGDELRDRRPCVSSLYPEKNHESWLGPADTIRGKSKSGDEEVHWSVTLVASPETAGIVIPSWDGSIRLTAQISEKRRACPADWATEFKRLLLLDDKGKINASASLVVNGYPLSYKRARLEPTKSQADCRPENGIYQGSVSIILDMHPNQANFNSPGSALSDIERLLFEGRSTPSIELHITVSPSSALAENIQLVPEGGEIVDLTANQNDQISNGMSRPPVALRFPLWVVMPDRGSLALEPSTLIFTDPAYNAGLSSPPYDESVRVTGADHPLGRGALYFVLSADRRRVNRQGSVVLMPDLRFEKKLDPATGDADFEINPDIKIEVKFALQPRTGERRRLVLHGNTNSSKLILGYIHELNFTTLTELDGNRADLNAGDILEVSVDSVAMEKIRLKNGTDAKPEWGLQNSVVLRLTLTNEPIVEPPSALYAALLLKEKTESNSLSLPLYAQSPLPWRVDIEDAAADFRAGLIRRKATFVWHLLNPFNERKTTRSYIVKVDRNGQTFLPAVIDEFNKSRNMT